MGKLVGIRDQYQIGLGQYPPLTMDEMKTIGETKHRLLTVPVSRASERLRALEASGAVFGHKDIADRVRSLLQRASGPGGPYIVGGESSMTFQMWMDRIQAAVPYLNQANQLLDQLASGAPPPRVTTTYTAPAPAPAPTRIVSTSLPNGRSLEQLPSVAQYRAWIDAGGRVVRDAPFRSPGGASGSFDTNSLRVYWRADADRAGVARVTRSELKAIKPTAPAPAPAPAPLPLPKTFLPPPGIVPPAPPPGAAPADGVISEAGIGIPDLPIWAWAAIAGGAIYIFTKK